MGGAVAELRDRIVALRRVKAADLRVNPKNWRMHPDGQRSAVSEMLSSIGFVGALAAREVDGGLELLDGHLRRDIAADSEVPVLVLDLNDEEADKMLATFDPLAGLALPDSDKLADLLKGISIDGNAEISRMFADLMTTLEREEDEDEEDEQREVVGMALQPHEHYDFLVVLCTTSQEWNVLCDKLGLVPQKRRGRMGTSRAIRADKLLKLLEQVAEGKTKGKKK